MDAGLSFLVINSNFTWMDLAKLELDFHSLSNMYWSAQFYSMFHYEDKFLKKYHIFVVVLLYFLRLSSFVSALLMPSKSQALLVGTMVSGLMQCHFSTILMLR